MEWVSNFAERFSSMIEGHTYQEVSEKLGISKALISYYAAGSRKPKTPALNHIAEIYGVDPVWLLGGDVPKYRIKKSPDTLIDIEGLSEDKRKLIEYVMSLTDEEVVKLRTFAEFVLSQRE